MQIPLSKSHEVALVDNEDYLLLKQYTWRLNKGYVINGHKVPMHRLIMKPPQNMEVDHVNHNRLDNQKSNLRICTHAENLRNSTHRHTNKSGYTGVFWDKTKKNWRVYCSGKTIGRFNNISDAIKSRAEAVEQMHGKFGVKG